MNELPNLQPFEGCGADIPKGMRMAPSRILNKVAVKNLIGCVFGNDEDGGASFPPINLTLKKDTSSLIKVAPSTFFTATPRLRGIVSSPKVLV